MRSVFFDKPPRRSSRDGDGWRWWVKVWLPVAVAVAILCAESTDTFSAQHTSGWLRPLVERWFGAFRDSTWNTFHHYLRKTGHFVGYGAVAFTFLRAWLHTLARDGISTLRSWRFDSSVRAILCTALVASCDEFHQTFIPSRTGTPADVLLDTCGATVLCLLVWLVCWSRRPREQYL